MVSLILLPHDQAITYFLNVGGRCGRGDGSGHGKTHMDFRDIALREAGVVHVVFLAAVQ